MRSTPFLLSAVAWATAADDIPSAAAAGSATPPDIVIMLTDDQRRDALGVEQRERGETARFPFFETPNLDRLASEGARARNAFAVQPCARRRAPPCSRASTTMPTAWPTT
jgi:hypothetical protein